MYVHFHIQKRCPLKYIIDREYITQKLNVLYLRKNFRNQLILFTINGKYLSKVYGYSIQLSSVR